jgi:hypothetical protein
MSNTNVESVYDPKYGGKVQTPIDEATVNALLAELSASAHTHANKALLDTYNFSNADVLDAIAKKHEPVTVAAGTPLGLDGQVLDFFYNSTYLELITDELSVKAGDLLLGANTNGLSKTGTGKTLGSDITLNLPQRIDTAATVRYENESIGGAYDASYKFKVYGNANVTGNFNIDGNVVIGGNLEVAGDSVTFRVGTAVVEDKNLEIAKIDVPTDTFANGGGLILKGSTDHTWIWDSTYQNWTSSEHVNIASGKSYKVNNNVVIDADRYGYLQKLNINGPATTSSAFNLNGDGKIWGDLFSDNFNSVDPYLGYYIGRNGSIFSKITATEMHVKNFITDLEFGFAGGMIIVKSVAELAADFTVGGNLQLKEYEGYSGRLMQDNDFVRLRNQTRGETSMSVTDIWGQVVYVSRNSTTKIQTYTFTKISGSGTGASKGTLALDYGTAGNGGLELVAINEAGKLPYLQTFSFTTNPWTDMHVNGRFGDLTGITTTTWGALAGKNGLYANVAYLEDDIYIGDTAVIGGVGVGMLNGMTALFHFDDNLYDSFNRVKPVYSGSYAETSYGLITATGLIATKASGKFGGAIAVEETTTNLFTTLDVTAWSNFDGNGTAVNAGDGWYELQSAEASDPLKRGSFTAPSTGSCTFSAIFRNGNSSSITFYLDIRDSSSTAVTLAAGETRRVTLTQTISNVSAWVDIRSTAALTKLYIKNPQIEFKAYATSFTQGTRAAGQLNYSNVLNPSAFTVLTWAYIDLSKSLSNGHILELSSDANNRLRINRNGTTNYLTFVFRKNSSDLISLSSSTTTITAGWHQIALTFSGSAYTLYVDASAYYPSQNVSTQINPDFILRLGHSYAAASHGNCIYDDTAIFNRALTAKEIEKIYRSNQPFNESAGLTVISGNQIKTGIIQSENYVLGVSGSMWNLNTGYLETMDGWFRGTITASAGTIGGWTISSTLLGITNNVVTDGYIFNLKPQDAYDRPVMEIYWANGSDLPSTGKNSVTIGGNTYLVSANGAFTTTGWDTSGEGGGLAVNINGKNVLFAGKRGSVVGAAIAGFMFDDQKFILNDGTNNLITLGNAAISPLDISVDLTSSLLTGAKFNSSTDFNAWTKNTNAFWSPYVVYTTAEHQEGAGAARFNGYSGSSPATNFLCDLYQSISGASIKGKTITISLWAKWGTASTTAAQNPTVSIKLNRVYNGDSIYMTTLACPRTANNTWLQYNFQVSVPSKTDTLYFSISLETSSTQTLYNSVNIDNISIKVYNTTQTFITPAGINFYSSPANYLSVANGVVDIGASELKLNGNDVMTWGGNVLISGAPANPRPGMQYYDSTYLYLYVDDPDAGVTLRKIATTTP